MIEREPIKIKEILFSAIGKDENKKKIKVKLLEKDWNQIVGPLLASHSRPYKLEGSCLWIYSDPGGWLQNLSLMSGMLLPKIQGWWGNEEIKDLKVVAKYGEMAQLAEEVPEEVKKTKISLLPEDFREVQNKIPSLQNLVLKEKVTEAFGWLQARKRVLKERNSSLCPSCGIYLENQDPFCFSCEQEQKTKRKETLRNQFLAAPWVDPKEMAKWGHVSYWEAYDVRNGLLNDLSQKVQPGEELSCEGLTLVMLITKKRPEELNNELIETVWNRIQREVRQDVLEKIKDYLRESPKSSYELINQLFPISIKEFEIARRNLLSDWKEAVKPGKEISLTGLKAAILVSFQEIDLWEEERILTLWKQIRKGGPYIFKYRPKKERR